jgi:hypothetical protein
MVYTDHIYTLKSTSKGIVISLSFWSKEKIAMYVDACEMLNYPEIPLGPYF